MSIEGLQFFAWSGLLAWFIAMVWAILKIFEVKDIWLEERKQGRKEKAEAEHLIIDSDIIAVALKNKVFDSLSDIQKSILELDLLDVCAKHLIVDKCQQEE